MRNVGFFMLGLDAGDNDDGWPVDVRDAFYFGCYGGLFACIIT